MAFNFNWSPLTADEDFYQRARDLLTTALNKSPKPPIIVDDILVTELNLGSVPPDLEILEIGDLAEDRFRGIFKMCYSGDAFLTLRTRVQANPLNTYLHSKPDFTSPQPLAAASGLTIPLSLTLSDIKLSAFIILVFSKQKGLTIVFRNDPLESLKVSSTFDSIQFVRDYLQKTIEGKLRDLMMDELPAIIHRLSLRLWCPDQIPREEEETPEASEPAVDPFASPPQDAVDANGNLLDPTEISSLSLDGGPEIQTLFSQKNLIRLATLSDCNRTMSLFTPALRDVVFRAWAGSQDKPDTISPPLATPSLTKAHSFQGNSTTYTFSDTSSLDQGYSPSRPSLASFNSATTGLSLGAGRNSKAHAGRKKKNRVVNLRRKNNDGVTESAPVSDTSGSVTDTVSVEGSSSEPLIKTAVPEEPEDYVPSTPTKVRFNDGATTQHPARPPLKQDLYGAESSQSTSALKEQPKLKQPEFAPSAQSHGKAQGSAESKGPIEFSPSRGPPSENPSVILEQAWLMKMAGEIARRMYDEKRRNPGFWEDREDGPPPAYEAQ
ncbi:Mitochondrial distribution and morphology protein 34 [Cytospora mali]|uniref:Mitochondrial distribution and morphology protein 34 n=1 Tax=Cytospora mali TaxID=578113 RepID=A0A194VKZ0_CYTMA|nr:Mitochondrial distribution and morphology protein 34 [Valsa mali]